MPKKNKQHKFPRQDFTINDCANALKPTNRVKKTNVEIVSETPWDEVNLDDFDILEEIGIDGTKKLVYKKKQNGTQLKYQEIDERPGIVYPEIVWYLISRFVKPEDVGIFAGINRATHNITKREFFWRKLYELYCESHPKLPARLRLERSFKLYGLKQRVVRALYHTYDAFIVRVVEQASHGARPHELIKRRCVNIWYCKETSYWSVYFKFKRRRPFQKVATVDFIEELGRIDANPEDDVQVLQVLCKSFHDVPPLMGMTLATVNVMLSQGLRHHRLHLGFTASPYNISQDTLPEHSVVLVNVINMMVLDWWHPKYPHFDNKLPSNISVENEEVIPALKQDFFKSDLDL